MTSLDRLRRDAKALKKAYEAGDPAAAERIRSHPPRLAGETLKHADFLHVIAREQQFESWPRMKLAAETVGLDRAAKQQRLKVAVYQGQHWVVDQLLADAPDLADGMFGLQCALYDLPAVTATLAADPQAATREVGPRRPILHLAFSRHFQAHPEKRAEMLAIAELLLANGADVNDSFVEPTEGSPLSALYGALGHAGNMALAEWLLDHGANPNDNESLYHATELGHHDGIRLLLAHGADPKGTNALYRAMDFDDAEAVGMLLAAGADASEPVAQAGALHHAARRMCGAEIARLLIEAGADTSARAFGVTPYALARVYGNAPLAAEIDKAGGATELDATEELLVRAADGEPSPGRFIDPGVLPHIYRDLIREMAAMPDKLPHIRHLVALGMEYDRPDGMGVPPVQMAGWEGLPEMLGYFLSLRPDLTRVNRYGGTLLGTIVHGSENCPQRATRDHIGCARMALEHGVALPRHVIREAGDEAMAAFLSDWAEARPGQVVHGSA
jgi:hypothetical protein